MIPWRIAKQAKLQARASALDPFILAPRMFPGNGSGPHQNASASQIRLDRIRTTLLAGRTNSGTLQQAPRPKHQRRNLRKDDLLPEPQRPQLFWTIAQCARGRFPVLGLLIGDASRSGPDQAAHA